MKSKLILICTVLATLALAARAQSVFQYNNGDLILDFSLANYPDVEIDIGSASALTSLAQASGGTVVLGVTNYSFSSTVLNNFNGSLSGVFFAVVGTSSTSSPFTNWLTETQPGANPDSPHANLTNTKQGQVAGVVNGIVGTTTSTGILPWSTANAGDINDDTTNLVIIPTTGGAQANDSWR